MTNKWKRHRVERTKTEWVNSSRLFILFFFYHFGFVFFYFPFAFISSLYFFFFCSMIHFNAFIFIYFSMLCFIFLLKGVCVCVFSSFFDKLYEFKWINVIFFYIFLEAFTAGLVVLYLLTCIKMKNGMYLQLMYMYNAHWKWKTEFPN